MEKKEKLWIELCKKMSSSLGEEKAKELAEELKEELRGMDEEMQISYIKKATAKFDEELQKKSTNGENIFFQRFLIVAIIAVVIAIAFTAWTYLQTPRKPDVSTSSSNSSVSISKVSANTSKEDFEVFEENTNPQGKIIANNSEDNSLSGDVEKDTKTILDNARHYPERLKNYAVQFKIADTAQDTAEWVTSKNGKKYLNDKGISVYKKLEETLSSAKKNSVVIGKNSKKAVATGIVDGKMVQDQNPRSFEGFSAMEVRPKGDEENPQYILDYCGNSIYPTQIADVPKKKLNIPSTPPKGGGNTPKSSTPPKTSTPPPSSTTPPSSSTTPPPSTKNGKNAQLDPQNQGNAPIGGGVNQNPNVGEETPEPSFPNGTTVGRGPVSQPQTTPSSSQPSSIDNQTGGGSFTDSNGTTTIQDNGAISTPDGRNYSGLVDTTPPPKVNLWAGNSGNSEPQGEFTPED